MFVRLVCGRPLSTARRFAPAALLPGLLLMAAPLYAQTPSIAVGGGVRASYVHTDPDEGDATDQFPLDAVRLYVSGSATDNIKIMFNTEYNSVGNDVEVLDAAAQFAFSPKFNIWAGRFIPPSDRANLYGPFFASHWGVFTDGVQDGYPFIFQGRDNGMMYLGPVRQAEGLGRHLRRPDGHRHQHRPDGRSRPVRLLGRRGRLLPEWQLLR